MFFDEILILPYGLRAVIGSSLSNGSDSPSLFTAFTLNLYFFLGVNPSAVNSVLSGPTCKLKPQNEVHFSYLQITEIINGVNLLLENIMIISSGIKYCVYGIQYNMNSSRWTPKQIHNCWFKGIIFICVLYNLMYYHLINCLVNICLLMPKVST